VLLDHDREDEGSGLTCPHERDARSLRRVYKRAGRDGPVRRQRGRGNSEYTPARCASLRSSPGVVLILQATFLIGRRDPLTTSAA
jgi:hypothetical protein